MNNEVILLFFDLFILTISETLQTVQHIIKTTEERARVVQKVIHSSIIHHFHFCFAGYFPRSLCMLWFWRFVLYNVQASLILLICLFQIVIVIIIEINIVLKLNCIKLENLLLFSKLIFIQWINSTAYVFICCKHSVMYIVTLIKKFFYFIISIFMSYKFPRSTIVQYTNIPWSFKTDSSFPHLPLYLWQKLKDLSLSYKWINLSRLVWV